MNFDITRQSLPRTILCFLSMFAIFRGREYLFPPDGFFPAFARGSVGGWLAGLLDSAPWLDMAAAFLLVLIDGFYITRIIARNGMYVERTYMPAMIYIALSLGYCPPPAAAVMLLVAFLLIFAVENITSSFKRPGRIGFFFNASVAVGIAAVIYPAAAVFFPFVLVCLVLMGRGWRDWVVSFGAFLMPVFLYSYVHWGMGEEFLDTPVKMYSAALSPAPGGHGFHWPMSAVEYIMAGSAFVVLVISLAVGVRRRDNMRKRAAVTYGVFLWALIFAAAMFVLPGRSSAMLPIAAIPLAAVMPAYFNRRAGWVPNLLYLALFGSVVLYNLIPIIEAL